MGKVAQVYTQAFYLVKKFGFFDAQQVGGTLRAADNAMRFSKRIFNVLLLDLVEAGICPRRNS